mgnify:CR=1 FL=1
MVPGGRWALPEFSERDRMELQFIGSSGKILVSSYGLTAGMSPGTPDIYAAFQSRKRQPPGAGPPQLYGGFAHTLQMKSCAAP